MMKYYCEYLFSDKNDFIESVRFLIEKVEKKDKILKLVFFGNSTNKEYQYQVNLINTLAQDKFGVDYPLVTFVTQPVLGECSMSAEVHYLRDDKCELTLSYESYEDLRYIVIESMNSKTILTDGVKCLKYDTTIREQSDDVFNKINNILEIEGLETNDIIRQWNYINNITEFDGDIQNYQAFNDSRTLYYDKASWAANGYPAATGIGMDCGGVIVEVIASKINTGEKNIYPIDNSLQMAAHNYSQNVLLGEKDGRLHNKSTPKFERAKTIISNNKGVCFVSGTAAIRGELSLGNSNIEEQTSMTIENIDYLISYKNHINHGANINSKAEIHSIRVYVKNKDHYERARKVVLNNWGNIQAVYLHSDVCRDELLVEIEGIAQINR